jgi:hypothetical protein
VDVRQYFRKLREVEGSIQDQFACVTSLENPDGGKAGVVSEVTRELAAKLLVEGRAVLSSEPDIKDFFARRATQKLAYEKAEMANRLQVTIVSDPETGALSGSKVSGTTQSKKHI